MENYLETYKLNSLKWKLLLSVTTMKTETRPNSLWIPDQTITKQQSSSQWKNMPNTTANHPVATNCWLKIVTMYLHKLLQIFIKRSLNNYLKILLALFSASEKNTTLETLKAKNNDILLIYIWIFVYIFLNISTTALKQKKSYSNPINLSAP